MSGSTPGAATERHDPAADGVAVADNPIPWWWSALFLLTILFGVGYAAYVSLAPIALTPVERWSVANHAYQERKFAGIAEIPLSDEKMLRLMGDAQWRATGAALFARRCASCHGADGRGFVGPNLTDDFYKDVRSLTDVVRVVTEGAGGGTMPAQRGAMSESEIVVVAAYAASLRGGNLESARPAEGVAIPPWPAPVRGPGD
jgi:cytochrome c oxidase cbb3-type subunit 3